MMPIGNDDETVAKMNNNLNRRGTMKFLEK